MYDWDPNAASGAGAWESAVAEAQRWVYFQWQPVVELDAQATDAGGGAGSGNVVVQRTYTWGPDLSGSVTAAGGIGGLLASQDLADPNDPNDDRSFIHFYDGNGNTSQLVEWRGPTAGWDGLGGVQAARYEYDAYGNVLNDVTNATESGDYAEGNAWRFSTKPFDPVSGLGYWGYRWYSARMGRWCSRDPIGSSGGVHLGRFANNSPSQQYDSVGLCAHHSFGGACPRPPSGLENAQVDYLGYLSPPLFYAHFVWPWYHPDDTVVLIDGALSTVRAQLELIAYERYVGELLTSDGEALLNIQSCAEGDTYSDCSSSVILSNDLNARLVLQNFTAYWEAHCSIGPIACNPRSRCRNQATASCSVKWRMYDRYDFEWYDFPYGYVGHPFHITGEWEQQLVLQLCGR